MQHTPVPSLSGPARPGHAHRHDHGDHHHHGHETHDHHDRGNVVGPETAAPAFSLLTTGAAVRIAGAAILIAGLWAVTLWALRP